MKKEEIKKEISKIETNKVVVEIVILNNKLPVKTKVPNNPEAIRVEEIVALSKVETEARETDHHNNKGEIEINHPVVVNRVQNSSN